MPVEELDSHDERTKTMQMWTTHPRIETAHIPVWNAASVDDLIPHHVRTGCRSLRFVDPVWLVPMVMGNQAEFHRSICYVPDHTLELIAEWLLVEEDIRVPVLLIEPILHLLHAARNARQVAVSRE